MFLDGFAIFKTLVLALETARGYRYFRVQVLSCSDSKNVLLDRTPFASILVDTKLFMVGFKTAPCVRVAVHSSQETSPLLI